MSRSPQDVRVRFSAHRRVPRPARRQGLRPSASLHPSAVTHRRSRLAFAGLGLAAGAGLAGTVAVSAPAAGFGAVDHRTILHPAAAPPVATTTRRDPHPAGVAPVRASRTQGRQPLTRQVTRLVSRTIPVAPPIQRRRELVRTRFRRSLDRQRRSVRLFPADRRQQDVAARDPAAGVPQRGLRHGAGQRPRPLRG